MQALHENSFLKKAAKKNILDETIGDAELRFYNYTQKDYVLIFFSFFAGKREKNGLGVIIIKIRKENLLMFSRGVKRALFLNTKKT